MAYRQLSPHAREGRLELQQAAGVSGHNHVRVQRRDMARFPVAELRGGFRLHQVVDSRGTATDRGFGNFQQFELRDASQQRARLRADALRVLQVASVMIGDAQTQGVAPGARLKPGQKLVLFQLRDSGKQNMFPPFEMRTVRISPAQS